MTPVANARMYAVNPAAKAHWARLLGWVLARAELPWPVIDHDAPAPLSTLWARDDLGLAMMCGLPFATRAPRPTLLAAPLPSPARYGGRPLYWTDIVVRTDAPYRSLADTFGGVVGYTLADSFSGGVAFRQHLEAHRSAGRRLYREAVGGLIHARGVIEALVERRIDVGPLDSYYHDLLARHEPALAAQVRVIDRTPLRPIPPLVATAPIAEAPLKRLREALLAARSAPELAQAMDCLLLDGFGVPRADDYDVLAAMDRPSTRKWEQI